MTKATAEELLTNQIPVVLPVVIMVAVQTLVILALILLAMRTQVTNQAANDLVVTETNTEAHENTLRASIKLYRIR